MLKRQLTLGIFLFVTFTSFPTAQCQFFEFLNNLSPSSVIEKFRQLIVNSKVQLESEIKAQRTYLAQLESLQDFADEQDKWLEELAGSYSALLSDLPSLYVKVKAASDGLVSRFKKIEEIRGSLDVIHQASIAAADEVFNRIRELMKAMQAPEEDIPPRAFELIGINRRRPEYGEAESEGIGGWQLGTEREIFDRALKLLNDEKWQPAYDLFKQAWVVYNDTEAAGQHHSLDEVYIVDYVQYSSFKVGRVDEAHAACLRALNHLPISVEQRTRFQSAFEFYDQELSSTDLKAMYQKIDSVSVEEQIKIAKIASSTKQYNFCQEEVAHEAMKKLSENPELFCRYDNRRRHPLLMFSPVKEEILSLNPVAVLLYGLITEKEIQSLKDSAESKLESAGVVNNTNFQTDIQSHTRKARTAWIGTESMPALTARLEASLGVNPYEYGCEMYQVGHYNIGGHYSPHFDTLFDAAKNTGLGDRIATLLLYLNEVEQGGGTVFTDLRIRVNATKGAGVFWYNFHKNETPNMKTMHGACPVIRGEKWVANKWYRWRGQMVHRPHGIEESEDFTLEDLNLPHEIRYKNVKSR